MMMRCFCSRAQGRKQVSECFAGSSARFDDQIAAVGETLLDFFGHGVLAGAVFEGEGRVRENSAGMEEVVERGELLIGQSVFDYGKWGRWRHQTTLMISAVCSPCGLPCVRP